MNMQQRFETWEQLLESWGTSVERASDLTRFSSI